MPPLALRHTWRTSYPIDVLAERLNTTRGALYKTIHDARRKLRSALDDRELAGGHTETQTS